VVRRLDRGLSRDYRSDREESKHRVVLGIAYRFRDN